MPAATTVGQADRSGDWFGHEVFYQAAVSLLSVLCTTAGRNLIVVRVCQAVIGSIACGLLGLAGWRLFSKRTGLIAGLMLALYAPAVFVDGVIQKSVLDVFFICLMLWLIASIVTDRPDPAVGRAWWRWTCLGMATGGLSLSRENALVFTVVILAWALTGVGRVGERRLASAGAFLLGVALILVPVTARNSIVGGDFYLTTSQFGPNFYIGNNPRSDGTYMSLRFGRGAPEYERQDATEIAEHALGRR